MTRIPWDKVRQATSFSVAELWLAATIALPAAASEDSRSGDLPTAGTNPAATEHSEVVAPAQPSAIKGLAAPQSVTSATCDGCYAWSAIDMTDYLFRVSVRGKTRNYASEVICRQEAHLALIVGSQCYDGEYKYTGGTGYQYHVEDGALVDSGYHSGPRGWWTNANGHEWLDDGAPWTVSGGADLCRQY